MNINKNSRLLLYVLTIVFLATHHVFAQEPVSCDGCLKENICYPVSTRALIDEKPSYCDITKKFAEQKELGEQCQNNYECKSSRCSDGECISIKKELEETQSSLEKILNWLNTLLPGAEKNEKKASKYSNKEIFLISDEEWKNVLQLVPMVVWTNEDGSITKYPMLVYHKEVSGFDADSIIYFMQQYKPEALTIIGETPQELDNLLVTQPELGAGLSIDQIKKISIDSYFSYWASFKDVVYSEDDYETALIASTYASLINAPLVIQGTVFDSQNVLTGRNVICVGNVNINCNENYGIEQLQKKYVEMTNTDKILLVNPNDLNIKVNENLQPEKSPAQVSEIYSKTSLASPILASAKHELIISTTSFEYSDVDSFIENKIDSLQLNPEYLTIVAAPNAIDMEYVGVVWEGYYGEISWSTDAWQYSRLDDDIYLDLAVGRIFGLTLSDSSSNIARSVFYEDVLKNENEILMTRGAPFITTAAEVYAFGKVLSTTGYNTLTTPEFTRPEDWKNKFFISYNDHGSTNWAGVSFNDIPYLDNSFVTTLACLTCAFGDSYTKRELFCSNIIRKGGVGFIGATDVSGDINTGGLLSRIFAMDETVGKAFVNSKNGVISWDSSLPGGGGEDYNPMPWYTLIGDPTLKLKTVHTMPKPEFTKISEDVDSVIYRLSVPAMKINIPDEIKDLCQYPNQVVPLYFTTSFNRQPDTKTMFTTLLNTPQDFMAVAAREGWIIKKEKDNIYWLTSPFNYQNPYFSTANENAFTNFNFDVTLFSKAPDLTISDVSLVGKELKFKLKNIGNKEAILNTNLDVSCTGCLNDLCGEMEYYSYTNIPTELSLLPGGEKDLTIVLPDKGRTRNFEDYPKFMIFIRINIPQDFIEQNYNNNQIDSYFDI